MARGMVELADTHMYSSPLSHQQSLSRTCHRHKQSNTHVLQLSQRDHSLVMVADFYVSLHPSDLVYIFLSSLSPLSRLLLITHLLSPSFSLPFLTFNLHIRAYCRFQFNWASHKYCTKLQQTGLAVYPKLSSSFQDRNKTFKQTKQRLRKITTICETIWFWALFPGRVYHFFQKERKWSALSTMCTQDGEQCSGKQFLTESSEGFLLLWRMTLCCTCFHTAKEENKQLVPKKKTCTCLFIWLILQIF